MSAHMRNILFPAGSIHHHKEMISSIYDHQIIQDAAFVIGEQSITLTVHTKPDHIHRHKSFHGRCGIFTNELHLPHVGHVEQSSLVSGLLVFL